VLRALPLERFSDNFLFGNQILAECILLGARVGEISCPTHYIPEASSIGLLRSCEYGMGVLKTSVLCALRARFESGPPLARFDTGKEKPLSRNTRERSSV
jgi:hypothetical protein